MALDLLSNCQRFVLEDCGLSNELLAKLREDYRGRTKVVWRVYFGSNGTCLTDAEELVLDPGTFDLDTLKEGLLFLHQVRSVTLRKMTLPLEEFQAMAESFPDIAFHYTVEILGQELDSGTDTLDLSGMESADLEAVCGSLPLLPELQTVELCGADGSSQLSKEEAKALIAAAPEAVFHYAFDFYGQTLSTDMEEVILKKEIGRAHV